MSQREHHGAAIITLKLQLFVESSLFGSKLAWWVKSRREFIQGVGELGKKFKMPGANIKGCCFRHTGIFLMKRVSWSMNGNCNNATLIFKISINNIPVRKYG